VDGGAGIGSPLVGPMKVGVAHGRHGRSTCAAVRNTRAGHGTVSRVLGSYPRPVSGAPQSGD
jgi:hypothetical protein